MLKIKLLSAEIHRNECTYRPFIQHRDWFREAGIRFIVEGQDYDLTMVAQHSFCNKNSSYQTSIDTGKRFLERIEGDFVLIDGQDSASLVGTYDVFKESNAKLLLKNTLYRDKSDYSKRSVHGRTYWGESQGEWEYNYKIDEPDFSNIILSGTNWLSTVNPQWYDYKKLRKDIDVCALFAYPGKENHEFNRLTSKFYNEHREKCIKEINQLPASIKVAKLEVGERVPIEEYYQLMSRSKILIAPFGYGEIAPRDLESAMLGCILIKPDMDHLETIPNIYDPRLTYCPCKWDFSDLNQVIEDNLNNHSEDQLYLVENMRSAYKTEYHPEKLVKWTHQWLSKLPGFGYE